MSGPFRDFLALWQNGGRSLFLAVVVLLVALVALGSIQLYLRLDEEPPPVIVMQGQLPERTKISTEVEIDYRICSRLSREAVGIFVAAWVKGSKSTGASTISQDDAGVVSAPIEPACQVITVVRMTPAESGRWHRVGLLELRTEKEVILVPFNSEEVWVE